MSDRREIVVTMLAAVCKTLNLSPERGEQACLALLGQVPPIRAPQKWSERTGDDKALNPIQFLYKYWDEYIDSQVFYQVDLRTLDSGLFEAIKIFCRRRGQDPKTVLPPPSPGTACRVRPDDQLYADIIRAMNALSPADHGR